MICFFCIFSAVEHVDLLDSFAVQCDQHESVLNCDKTNILKLDRQDESLFSVRVILIEIVLQFKNLELFLSCDLRNSPDNKNGHPDFNRNLGMLMR